MSVVDDLRSGTWVTYVGGRATGVRVRRCRFEVIAGPDIGLVRDIEAATIRVGARRGNDIQLTDSKVSGHHFEIRLDERGYRLHDLGSTNGTHVAGLRVIDVYITPGAIIRAGSTKIRFAPLSESVERPIASSNQFGNLIGTSVKMRELFAYLEKLARSDATVLVTGETGVGKELVAESLHDCSPRASGPFEVLDCGAIPPNLIESQLFGHERGAFTGADRPYPGVFERADKGTVFLDEIGELPLEMQPKLLGVLERREVRRIGATRTIPVDIRIIAATNRDLAVEVNRGRFREDLYYRLAVARVHVPPLRERREDIPLLIEHFLESTPGAEGVVLEQSTLAELLRHDWPGNVRELRNVIERAVLFSGHGAGEPVLGQPPRSLPEPAELGASTGEPEMFEAMIDISEPFKSAKQALVTEWERRYLRKLLAAHDGNITQAARAAGLDRMSIHKMLNRLGLENPGRSDSR